MVSSTSSSGFSFGHGAWSALREHPLGPAATAHRLLGGGGETWWVDAAPSVSLLSRGLRCESTLAVLDGRLECTVFGNQVELPSGHFALVPPNVPFSVKVCGRAPATFLLICCTRVGENALEPEERS